MFTCKVCLRRALFSLHPNPHNVVPAAVRTLTTTTDDKPPSNWQRIQRPNKHDKPKRPFKPSRENAPRYIKTSAERAAEKELEYMEDPFHIAHRVRKALDQDDFEHAAMITRKATSKGKVIVSWNHLIDYQLKKDRIRTALKLFNDMKKRGQQPNAQTFTIFFRGMAKSTHSQLALTESVKMYTNMLSTGRLKPNTIHLNAVLHVCAKVEDIESMFSILQSSTDGLRAPNNLTYTTILNGLRKTVDNKTRLPNDLTEESIKDAADTVIKRAKAIWEEVISKWKSGTLIIDEELVCAMGRILLMGSIQDVRSIEDLVEQTMMLSDSQSKALSAPGKLSKQVKEDLRVGVDSPRPGLSLPEQDHAAMEDVSARDEPSTQENTGTTEESPNHLDSLVTERSSNPIPSTGQEESSSVIEGRSTSHGDTAVEEVITTEDSVSDEEAAIEKSSSKRESSREVVSTPPTKVASKFTATARGSMIKAPGAPALTHALPGNNSLSLLLESLERVRGSQKAIKYWGIITKRFGVEPDGNNWIRLLKVFSISKNSTYAIAYLKNCPRKLMTPKLFRTAMKTCLRENLATGTFKNGTQMIDLMCDSIPTPDVQVLRMYLQMTHAHRRSYSSSREGDKPVDERAMGEWARELTIALDKIWKPYQLLSKSCVIKKPETMHPGELEQARNFKAEVAALARKMVAAYDYLITASLVPMDVEKRMKLARNSINRFVVAHFEEIQSDERTSIREECE